MIRNLHCTRISIFAAALALALLPSASVSAGGNSKVESPYQATIQDFSFQPATLNVPVGATVTWTNKDEEPHTVFSADNFFKSKALDTDDKFSFTFTKAGTYKYFCTVHPKMVAIVIVGSSKKKSEPMKMEHMKPMN